MQHYTRIILVFFLWLFSGYAVKGQTANFTEDYISGCAPLLVHFTNTSSGATSYSWDLGNGVITPLTDPSTSYTSAGTYTVTLTAFNGSSSGTHTVVITVYPTPVVSFTADDTAVCLGTPVTFTSTSSSGVAGPVTYMWNFGDGASSTLATPSHVYTAPGYYNVTLSVTNSQGCVSSLTKLVYIHVFTPPVANFTANTTFICNPPGNVTFTNTSGGTAPFTCTWTYGDGGTGSGSPSSHTYTTPGTYTVKLVVTDANGCKDSMTRTAYITVGTIDAAFTGPTTACVYSSVTFTNTSSPHTSSSWTFGDGGTSTSNDGTHIYSTPGTYTVTLIIFNGGCSDTITHTITILPGPVASFTMTPTSGCPGPTTVTFTGTVPAGSTAIWYFGDGGTGSGTTTTHTYTACGAYIVKMIVTGTTGCIDTIIHEYDHYNLNININHDSIPSGCVPLTVLFHCYTSTTCPTSGPYPFGITSYTWNFGDGSPTTGGGVTISHTYTATGTYVCTVYIVTANGCLDTAHLNVLVGTPPVANFTATPTHVCYGHMVTFDNTSTGATNYLWFFGDSSTSTAVDPTHFYDFPGTYWVMLIAYNNGCPDTLRFENYIIVDSPKAIIASNYVCIPANEVAFGDSSLGDNTHLWIFGDGTTSTADNIIHDYPALSTYTVTLATYNTASGCRDTAKLVINLIHPTVTFTANDTTICKYQSVTFTPVVVGDSAVSYAWYDNGSYLGSGMTYSFNVTGYHTIMLIITDQHGCMDTVKRINYILVAKPIASFTEVPASGCAPLIVTFTDHSTDVTGLTLTNYNWIYGDGASGAVTTPTSSHTYTASGTYGVTEIVTDSWGCKDTVTLPGLITVYKPHAVFSAAPTYPCVGTTVIFNNTSAGIVSSSWLFGDGGTSSVTSPTHVYTSPGVYTVTLIVTDAHGCTDTAKYINYINVTQPVAAFTESDSFSVCAPLSETFTNASTGAVSYNWTFGDGNSSTSISPSDLYITSGFFTVMLIATNAYGCKDTAIRHVNIYGYAGAFSYTPDTGCAPLTVYFSSTLDNVPNIIWDFGDGTTSSSSSTEDTVHTYTLPGAYIPKLILSDNSGCQNSSTGVDTIKVDAVTAGFKTLSACLGDTTRFFDTSSSYWSTVTSWLWMFDGGPTSTLPTPTHLYTIVGTYNVTLQATDAWGCTATINREVIIASPPVITASGDTTVCVGDPATLTGYGGVSYTWSPPVTLSCTACNPTAATPTVVTTYTVSGTDEHGCVGTDTVTVYLRTKTISNAFGDTAVCLGIKVPLYDTGATTYTWLPSSGLSSSTISNPIADPDHTTTYTIIAQLGNCIPDTDYVTVTVYPLPTVDAGPDQTLLAGSDAQLKAIGTNISIYSWKPSETLSCDSCYNPVASMSVSTTYTVDVFSPHDCRNSDSVRIHLYCSTGQLFIPNSFTPNGDGQNDVFYPRGSGVSIVKTFRIYNRWGELLFEKDNIQLNDETNAWNGSFGSTVAKPDVYVYVIEALCETGEPLFVKGDVTIIK